MTLDLPSELEQPVRADRDCALSTDRPKARDTIDPGERGRAYEAMRAHVSAETAEFGAGRHPDGRYWEEAPRLLDRAAEYRERWLADRQPVPDRPVEPSGSFRSSGGFYLSPERHAEVIASIGRVREAEPAISADMRAVEQGNRHGGWLEGFEYRLKDNDRLKEKIAEQLKAEPGMTAGEILDEIPDAIRYTFCLESGHYFSGYGEIKGKLENLGYELYLTRNSWSSQEYKGVNTRWVTQDGQRFEVQFHTAESFHAKQYVTHDAYERIRNPWISDHERRELREFQREVSSALQMPDGAVEIPNYKKEGF